MTSILTNVAANTALLNLENTVTNLQNIQNQISTGLRVSSAADNAAYYSIATVLRSDSSALSTVSDALNLGGSSLDVASSAISKINTTLSDIKNQLLAATSPGVDRTKIQEQITQDQAQLKNIANSANFNGQNFLSVNSASCRVQPDEGVYLVLLARCRRHDQRGDHRDQRRNHRAFRRGLQRQPHGGYAQRR